MGGLCVLEEYRGRGVGKRLHAARLRAAAAMGIERLFLFTEKRPYPTVELYERFGWTVWAGPTFVWMDVGPVPTPDEDGSVLVLRTATTPELDPASPLICEWRPGDVW